MSRPRIYVSRQIPDAAIEILEQTCALEVWSSAEQPVPRSVLLSKARDVDGLYVLLTDPVDTQLLDAAPRLRAVSNMGVGYDNIDVPACTARGILVTNTPEVLTETVADLVFGLMLAAARRIVEGRQVIERGEWQAFYPFFMTGVDVHGATLGIIGAGRIGTAVARRGRGFGMGILYHNRRPSPGLEREAGAEYRTLDELLRQSDFVVILAPLTPESRGLIGSRELALLKPTAVLINAARGPLVDEAALYRALADRRIHAAALDVFDREPIAPDHPLLKLPNCVVTPHIGSATVATRTRMATLAAENLVAALTGRRPPAPLNPEVMERPAP